MAASSSSSSAGARSVVSFAQLGESLMRCAKVGGSVGCPADWAGVDAKQAAEVRFIGIPVDGWLQSAKSWSQDAAFPGYDIVPIFAGAVRPLHLDGDALGCCRPRESH